MATTYDNTTETTTTDYDRDLTAEDEDVAYGIDGSTTGDAEKGATLGGIGGAVTGAVAGAMAGPIGAVAGAIIGGVAGAVASGAAVGAVDRIDNDNTVSGLGTSDPDYIATTDPVYTDTATYNAGPVPPLDNLNNPTYTGTYPTPGNYTGTDTTIESDRAYNDRNMVGNGIPGIQTGGVANDGTPDTRGVWEKTADAVTGDDIDDKTGRVVDDRGYNNSSTYNGGTYTNSTYNTGDTGITNSAASVGNGVPGVQTGGYANDGTPDTRGIAEKTADALTGDDIDDKTGKVVDHS
jgi:hypothetical protein